VPPSHHPPHLYLDDTWYMITGSVFHRDRLLTTTRHKETVRDCLKELVIAFGFELAAWVILDNHYHILVRGRSGADVPRFVGRLHGRTSYEINNPDNARGRQVWHNYFDTCVRGERGYWVHFNYIHHNPVKHGYVATCGDWDFSSYGYYLRTKGEEWLADAFRRYPIVDFTYAEDERHGSSQAVGACSTG